MNNYLIKSFLLLVVFCSATAIHSYDFSAKNSDGVIIYYNIINETDKTCEVTCVKIISSWTSSTISTDYVGDVNIPSKVIGYNVTKIGHNAFNFCKNLTSVTIPNSVTSIGISAFRSCIGLTSVTIPNSVTSIGQGAFNDCDGLTFLRIPKSVTSLMYNPFSDCSNLTSIVVEEGNPNYNSNNNCNAIINSETNELVAGCKNSVIPNYITSIGDGSFSGCSGLTSITIPNSVTSIGTSAFLNCI